MPTKFLQFHPVLIMHLHWHSCCGSLHEHNCGVLIWITRGKQLFGMICGDQGDRDHELKSGLKSMLYVALVAVSISVKISKWTQLWNLFTLHYLWKNGQKHAQSYVNMFHFSILVSMRNHLCGTWKWLDLEYLLSNHLGSRSNHFWQHSMFFKKRNSIIFLYNLDLFGNDLRRMLSELNGSWSRSWFDEDAIHEIEWLSMKSKFMISDLSKSICVPIPVRFCAQE